MVTRKVGPKNDAPVNYKRDVAAQRRLDKISVVDQLIIEHMLISVHDFNHFATFLCGLRPHPGQLQAVEFMNEKDYGVLTAANGWGKTLFYALLMLWASSVQEWAPSYWKSYLAVALGPEMKQALLIHQEIEAIRNNRHKGQFWDGKQHKFLLGSRLIPWTTRDGHLAYKWRHNNANLRFESAEGKASAIEGWAPNLIIYDEARLELHLEYIVQEVFLARATRAPNMKIILGSTPIMDSYDLLEYYKRGERGDQDWWSRSGNIDENIYADAEQIEKVRRNLDPRVRDQVLAGKFVEPPDAYFISERAMECFDDAPEPDNISEYSGKYVKGHTYVAGVDTAVSEGGDESVVTLWDVTATPHRVILEKVFPKGTALGVVVAYCDVLIQIFSCQVGYDAQGPLGVEFQHQTAYDPGWYVPVKFGGAQIKGGTSQQKSDAMANFRHFLNNKLWSAPNIRGLKAQIIGYKVKDQHLRKDRLMAQVYAAWVAKDYLNESGDIQFDDMRNIYAGEGYQFGRTAEDDNISPLQRRWKFLVAQHDAREKLQAEYDKSQGNSIRR